MPRVVQSDFLVSIKKAAFDCKLEVRKVELHQICTSTKPGCWTQALWYIPSAVGGLRGLRQTVCVWGISRDGRDAKDELEMPCVHLCNSQDTSKWVRASLGSLEMPSKEMVPCPNAGIDSDPYRFKTVLVFITGEKWVVGRPKKKKIKNLVTEKLKVNSRVYSTVFSWGALKVGGFDVQLAQNLLFHGLSSDSVWQLRLFQ